MFLGASSSLFTNNNPLLKETNLIERFISWANKIDFFDFTISMIPSIVSVPVSKFELTKLSMEN